MLRHSVRVAAILAGTCAYPFAYRFLWNESLLDLRVLDNPMPRFLICGVVFLSIALSVYGDAGRTTYRFCVFAAVEIVVTTLALGLGLYPDYLRLPWLCNIAARFGPPLVLVMAASVIIEMIATRHFEET